MAPPRPKPVPTGPVKAPDKYSTNPNTLRARARRERLPPSQRLLETAKNADQRAVSRAWKMRVESSDYQRASEEDRAIMLQEAEKEVLDRRHLRGIDVESKMGRFYQEEQSKADQGPAPHMAAPGYSAFLDEPQPQPQSANSAANMLPNAVAMPVMPPSMESPVQSQASIASPGQRQTSFETDGSVAMSPSPAPVADHLSVFNPYHIADSYRIASPQAVANSFPGADYFIGADPPTIADATYNTIDDLQGILGDQNRDLATVKDRFINAMHLLSLSEDQQSHVYNALEDIKTLSTLSRKLLAKLEDDLSAHLSAANDDGDNTPEENSEAYPMLE
ncbi:hypothetical protein F4778DRAFT_779816 [Xylariomycetidae sp. FL2044]|nr:hypothetical protein F4778DRAFT_779816 [Xylariomycetidae sp. FL2044]